MFTTYYFYPIWIHWSLVKWLCVYFRERGACAGVCKQALVTMTFLVLDGDLKYKFDEFDIPAYCICKNVHLPTMTTE